MQEKLSHSSITVLENVSYAHFYKNYLIKNVPCLLKNATFNWNSTKQWVEDSKPNFPYLSGKYGNSNVTVHNCREQYFNSQQTQSMLFKDYIEYWKSYIESKYSSESPLFYLKDWHLKNELKNDNFYEVPIYFSSDWLNEYLTSCGEDDYRFVYMGPKGSWTPFHQDVFTSYSWSANICGMKRWILFPPGEEGKLVDELGNLLYSIEKIPSNVEYFEVMQGAGDAIFVPSGWHHQVWNVKDTISINHNWINAGNIEKMWKSMNLNLDNVKVELSDCRDMENYFEQCQLILCSIFGMDFLAFHRFIKFIASRRLNGENLLGVEQCNFLDLELKSLKSVFEAFINHGDLEEIKGGCEIKTELSILLRRINSSR